MIPTGIPKVDSLWEHAAEPPIARGDPDAEAVVAIQQLLLGYKASIGIPDGIFGPGTARAVSVFQGNNGREPTGQVDHDTLRMLAEKDPPSPIISRAYLALVLDCEWSGFNRLVAITAGCEGAGKFAAINPNTDGAGLSFGLIQWAQRPKRLNELVNAFQQAQPDRFVEIFGAGELGVASGLLAHTAKPNGGVTDGGKTTDPAFNLTDDVWTSRFAAAALDRVWQKTQLDCAIAAFRQSCTSIRTFLPVARSERAFAFLLDTANQHGDNGLKNICAACVTPVMDEPAALQAIENESVRRVTRQFGEGSNEVKSTRDRRDLFRTSAALSGDPFQFA
ncbi:MAG TPA: peptidoglycan-binding domain-containing protein [Bryobacteraceae bacterium]|nr:peptidoglycan-binding domain-containing protein [Bryobacteraceae bacterium]